MRYKAYENIFDPLGIDKNKSDLQRLSEDSAASSAAFYGQSPPSGLGPNGRRVYEQNLRRQTPTGRLKPSNSSGDKLKKMGDAIERIGSDHEFDPKVFRKRRLATMWCIAFVGGLWLLVQWLTALGF